MTRAYVRLMNSSVFRTPCTATGISSEDSALGGYTSRTELGINLRWLRHFYPFGGGLARLARCSSRIASQAAVAATREPAGQPQASPTVGCCGRDFFEADARLALRTAGL